MKQASNKSFWIVQAIVLVAVAASAMLSNAEARMLVREQFLGEEPFQEIEIPRTEPLRIEPLYDRPEMVSDEDLAAVLAKIIPRFAPEKMKPNHVEHALRTWAMDATFQDPKATSGAKMVEFLTDHAAYMESWGKEMRPMLEERETGIYVRWGEEPGLSYHHDHLIACLTEAGVPLDHPVYGPSRSDTTLYDVIQQSLRDFRLDERETEWTAMAFGLWIPPTKEWIGSGGRQYSFDLLVRRLLRGHKQLGVCNGTHRVYSLMLLIRLDDEFDILSDSARAAAYSSLETVRDRIMECQFEDGHWPSNWPDGKDAVENPIEDELYQQVITTGHHLEWLSIAPPELHPPQEMIEKAAAWVIKTTKEQTPEEIKQRYTFFSHVGSALANWRQVRPADFWREWEAKHPWEDVSQSSETAASQSN